MKAVYTEPEIISLQSPELNFVSCDVDFDKAELTHKVNEVLRSLTPREERVLRLRYFEGYTLREVGEQFGCCYQNIRQIEAKALRKLKHPSRSRYLRTFLNLPVNENFQSNDSLLDQRQRVCDKLYRIIGEILLYKLDIWYKPYVFEDGTKGIVSKSTNTAEIYTRHNGQKDNIMDYTFYEHPIKVCKETYGKDFIKEYGNEYIKIKYNKYAYENDKQINNMYRHLINIFIELCQKVGHIQLTGDYIIVHKHTLDYILDEIETWK